MDKNGKDIRIEEIDKELRAINARLKKVLSETDALLNQSSNGIEETELSGDAESDAEAEESQG